MSGRQVSRPNPYGRVNHPNNASFPPQTPGWTQCPSCKGLPTQLPNSSYSSSCSGHSEQTFSPTSSRLPLGGICMDRHYNTKCKETGHVLKGPTVARKPAGHHSSPHCLLCTDRPSCPSSPTFLDQLIKGINYLDRSNIFGSSYPKALSLPQLAATYLERAANSLYLDQQEHTQSRSYSNPSANATAPDHPPNNTCLVPSTSSQETNALQRLTETQGLNCQHRSHNQSFGPETTQRPGVKLPELPLLGSGLFSLGRLPKIWESLRSGWNPPEPISKPSNWW